MKALVKTKDRNKFRTENKPIPELKNDDEFLIKVDFCGVCGSDLHAANHANGYEFVPKPIVFGHEISGTVVKAYNENKYGDLLYKRVMVEPIMYCSRCKNCKKGDTYRCFDRKIYGLHIDGAMAEYIKAKTDSLHVIPDTLDSEIACLTEPLAVAINAVHGVGKVSSGEEILVQGCGIIGFFTALVAKEAGANVIISGLSQDWNYRLRHAKNFGIQTEIVNVTKSKAKKYDKIFECSGSSDAAEMGVLRLKKGGTLILVALYENQVIFPINDLIRKKVDILTSHGSSRDYFKQSLVILNKYNEELKKIISIYPLSKGAQAFDDARNQRNLKPIIKINN